MMVLLIGMRRKDELAVNLLLLLPPIPPQVVSPSDLIPIRSEAEGGDACCKFFSDIEKGGGADRPRSKKSLFVARLCLPGGGGRVNDSPNRLWK